MNRHERRKQEKQSGRVSHEQITATFSRAVERHQNGDLAGAEELYRRVLEWSPESPEPWTFLGAIAIARGDMVKAEKRYEKALALKPDWPEALSARGTALLALGRYDEAERALRRATDIDPRLHAAWNSLGICVQHGGALVEAQDCFRRATELAPGSARYVYNVGLNLKHQARYVEARAEFEQALRHDDRYADALAQMAHCFRLEGADASAASVYAKYLELEPEDTAGAQAFIAARAAGTTPSAHSKTYVRKLFDEYAQTYDEHLAHLESHGPELVERALRGWMDSRGPQLDMLDLGCGTGLVGVAVADRVRKLVGVDLSTGMLERARARGIYHELVALDIVAYLQRGSERFDVAVAADVFIYVGNLQPVLDAVRSRLHEDGRLAFTVESGDREGLHLERTLRFTHGEAYVRGELARAGFEVVSLEREVLRRHHGAPVAGLVLVARPVGSHSAR